MNFREAEQIAPECRVVRQTLISPPGVVQKDLSAIAYKHLSAPRRHRLKLALLTLVRRRLGVAESQARQRSPPTPLLVQGEVA